jgi:hypothetical protein
MTDPFDDLIRSLESEGTPERVYVDTKVAFTGPTTVTITFANVHIMDIPLLFDNLGSEQGKLDFVRNLTRLLAKKVLDDDTPIPYMLNEEAE